MLLCALPIVAPLYVELLLCIRLAGEAVVRESGLLHVFAVA